MVQQSRVVKNILMMSIICCKRLISYLFSLRSNSMAFIKRAWRRKDK